MEKPQLFWQTYLSLEKELLEVAKYIYITDEVMTYSNGQLISSACNTQLDTFSPHIADLLIRACVEIEAVSKELYFDFCGTKERGDKNLFFDEDCLKLIDQKCKTHQKVVMISCSSFNLTKDENACFKPLKEAHKRQGTNWEKAYQAVKHDRYASIKYASVKNLLHAMGALYLLNIYYKDVRLYSRYLEFHNLDYSFGSSIFSVKQPDEKYVIDVINNTEIADILQANESPFVLKYTDSCYNQILDSNKTMTEEMNRYWLSQPELQESNFIEQMIQAKKREEIDPCQCVIQLWELAKYRLWKKIPEELPFEERRKRLIASPEWNGKIRLQNPHLNDNEILESNIDSEIEKAGIYAGMELQQRFENIKMCKAFEEGYCELILDKGNVRYIK